MSADRLIDFPHPRRRVERFLDWRGRLDREQIAPIVAIAGTRGKTSVVRLVETILRGSGYRVAAWTDNGVEIDGERQRGELGPWSRALTRLKAGGLDIALQEVDWNTVPAIDAPGSRFPVVAVANLCTNNEACLVTPDMLQARRALGRLRQGVAAPGRLILNADDFAVADGGHDDWLNRILVGKSQDTPILRRHIDRGGDACWLVDGQLVLQEDAIRTPICSLATLQWTHGGRVPFAGQTALLATAIARSVGIPENLIASGLASHEASPELNPGAFNVFDVGSATVVVDSPVPPWFLRTTLRGVAGFGQGRHIRIAGPMPYVESHDLIEVGRLLGRAGGALILHGPWSGDRLDAVRQGASANQVPPLIVQLPDERTAVQHGVAMLKSGDVLLVLAENAPAVVRQLDRWARKRSQPERRDRGSA